MLYGSFEQVSEKLDQSSSFGDRNGPEERMVRTQSSGYDHRFRLEVLKSALNAFEQKKDEDKSGRKKMYRERTWNRKERRKEKLKRKKNWFGSSQVESVLFIPATPNSTLKRRMQDELKAKDMKIKVIEKSRTKIVRLLQRNDPFKKKECVFKLMPGMQW